MSKTIRIADGDIYIDSNGQSSLVDSVNKSGQDIAAALLIDYDANTSFGSELATFVQSPYNFISDGIVQQLILEAVQRLQAKQQQDSASTSDERIARIKDLRIDRSDNGDVFFYLELETETGSTLDRAFLIPMSLDQQFSTEML